MKTMVYKFTFKTGKTFYVNGTSPDNAYEIANINRYDDVVKIEELISEDSEKNQTEENHHYLLFGIPHLILKKNI